MPTSHPTAGQQFHGRVVSAKTPKTIVVAVARTVRHPKYHKVLIRHQRFQVHDPLGRCREGDTVRFISCRPISKTKRWRVLYGELKMKNVK